MGQMDDGYTCPLSKDNLILFSSSRIFSIR